MDRAVQEAIDLLDKICEKYGFRDSTIMQGIDGEKAHAIDVMRWVQKINPHANSSLKVAALYHDIDRIVTEDVGDGYKGDRKSSEYLQHKKDHAKRSAQYIMENLAEIMPEENMLRRIEFLILHHDDGSDKLEVLNDADLNTLVTADTFSFFTTIAPTLYAREGEGRLKDKVRFMVDKLTAKQIMQLKRYQLENPLFNKIKNEVIEEHQEK